MATDKSCWTCKYLGNWTGDTFIQDFTCAWFPRHGKGEEKKLWPQKDPDEGCKFLAEEEPELASTTACRLPMLEELPEVKKSPLKNNPVPILYQMGELKKKGLIPRR